MRVVRDGTVIYDTSISQLKRFKDDAREVSEGFECGILLEGYNDLKEGDILEAYETRQVERTDLDEPVPAPAAAPARRQTSMRILPTTKSDRPGRSRDAAQPSRTRRMHAVARPNHRADGARASC